MAATSTGRIVVSSLALVATGAAALVFGITHVWREPPAHFCPRWCGMVCEPVWLQAMRAASASEARQRRALFAYHAVTHS
jgi:hypothetical protein